MTTILAAIFVFGVLITVHEFGHFITAKMTGMRVDEFAIGFGPNIFQKKVGGFRRKKFQKNARNPLTFFGF